MSYSTYHLTASEAARQLGISAKALRLYEQRGLIRPARTSAGWRTYSPKEMARAAEIAALRALGLTLAQVKTVLYGDPQGLEPALAAHQRRLEEEMHHLSVTIGTLRDLTSAIAAGKGPDLLELARLARPASQVVAAFPLPWPWGGESFELRDMRALTYIVGPLGSGKTRFAKALAESLPEASFIDLDRAALPHPAKTDRAVEARIERTLSWLGEDGATMSAHLAALVAALESEPQRTKVVDMIEHGLDRPTQEAVIAWLRQRAPQAVPLFLMTRSSSILDLAALGPHEAVLFCPANHKPPMRVGAYPGAPGYEAVETCLAPPDVRARTEGVIAFRPQTA